MAMSLVEPSVPQFHERLSSLPSLFSSPLSRLCLRSKETRSVRVKPSWQVTKLMEATGRRPEEAYRSAEPVSREANSGSADPCPRQKSRTISRYCPFHSVHNGGKFPTW